MSHSTVSELASATLRDESNKIAASLMAAVDKRRELTSKDLIWTSLIAGAVAGALAKTVIAPLDRTKINFQISNRPYSAKGAYYFLIESYKKEGLLNLWRGNSATMARIVPYAAIQFTAHEQWKRVLHIDTNPNEKVSPWSRLLAGSLAGVTSQSLTYPLDLARARMAVTQKDHYNTLRQVFVKIWVEEGPRTFYRGLWPTIVGVIPYAGVSFFTYDSLKRLYADYTGSTSPNAIASLAFGAVAGMLGQSSSYPLDIVRRRMQTSPSSSKIYGGSIMSALIKIYRMEGIKGGLYKGLSMNWVKGPVAVGISFATYESTKEYLRQLLVAQR